MELIEMLKKMSQRRASCRTKERDESGFWDQDKSETEFNFSKIEGFALCVFGPSFLQ